MSTKSFLVPNISCGHCTRTIEMELGEIDGVRSVIADKDSKQVTVEWQEPASWTQIDAALHEINYPPEQLIKLS
ncbi:MAG: heavy-metal-associated domain-containing protein [Candidatus Promineifilaceae bacterium]|nr:heavy-metal-associated domain-containing protein [Candidatus Promineifilaceae bacterium]